MPLMSVSTLRAKMGAARLALEAAANTPNKAAISMVHRAAVVDQLQRSKGELDTESRVALTGLATNSQWAPTDLALILAELTDAPLSAAKRRRVSQQVYENFMEYIDSARWEILQDPAVNTKVKESVVLQMCLSLGMWIPSEPTMKKITAFLMVLTVNWDSLQRLPADDKFIYKAEVQREWLKIKGG